jgi:hypothetical protein
MKYLLGSLLVFSLLVVGCAQPQPEVKRSQVSDIIKNWQDITAYPEDEMIISGQALLIQKNLLFFFDSVNFRESIVVDYNRLNWETRQKIDAFDLTLKPLTIRAVVNKNISSNSKPAVIAVEILD